MASSDYKRLPGTAARYVKVRGPGVGETISKRQHDKMRAAEAGLVSRERFLGLSRHPEYMRHLAFYAAATKTRRRDLRRIGSEFNRLWAAVYIKLDGTIRTQAETYKEGKALFRLLYAEGFVSGEDYSRYVKG